MAELRSASAEVVSAATLDLRALFRSRLHILDGATGTELKRRGIPTDGPLWATAALRTDPEIVAQIHAEYIAAGADLITTNTFRLTTAALRADRRRRRLPVNAPLVESELHRLQRRAVALARQVGKSLWRPLGARRVGESLWRPTRNRPAARARPILIAGSLGPCADCYTPAATPSPATLQSEHKLRLPGLAGADLLWFETLGTLREARAAAKHASTAGRPFAISLILRESGQLLGGDDLSATVQAISRFAPVAIGLNCIPPDAIARFLPQLRRLTDLPLAVYAHINNRTPLPGWTYVQRLSPRQYAAHARRWRRAGANLIGGCCGTTPAHIAAVAAALGK
jgi:S-methylmethionine-dependent homocysteine/selenocysteine methylase